MYLYSRRESEEYRGPEREFEPSPNGPFETKWGCTVEVEGDDRDSTIFIAGGEQEPVGREKNNVYGVLPLFLECVKHKKSVQNSGKHKLSFF